MDKLAEGKEHVRLVELLKKGFAVKGLGALELDILEQGMIPFGCFQSQGGSNARGSHHK